MLKKTILILFLFIPGLIFADIISGSIRIDKEKLSYGKSGSYDTVTYPETKRVITISSEPGEPGIPSMYFKVLVPEDAVFDSIEISNVNVQLAKQDFNCMPMQEPYTDKPGPFVTEDPEVYQKRRLYPYTDKIRFIDEGIVRGYKIFTFNINFLELNPVEKILYITEGFDYIINYTRDSVRAVRATTPTHSAFAEIISGEVENSYDQNRFYGIPRNELNRSENIDFLIITDEKNKSAYDIYGEERQKRTGLSYKVITLDQINKNPLFTSNFWQLKIKKAIKYYIDNYNTSFVYLGHISGSRAMWYKKCFVDLNVVSDKEKYNMSTDLFYACMDRQFDWNAVKNREVGNFDDNVDMYPDVFIGRGSFNMERLEILQYLRKIELYDTSTSVDKDLSKTYLISAMNNANKGESTKLSEYVFNKTINNKVINHKTKIMTEDNSWLNYDNLNREMEKGYNLMYMAAHSTGTRWKLESGDSLPGHPNRGRISGIVVSDSCHDGYFPGEYSICNNIYRRSIGHIGYLGVANVGLYLANNLQQSYTLKYTTDFIENLNGRILPSQYFGSALADTKIRYASLCKGASKTPTYYRSQHYLLNLSGDPTIQYRNARKYSFTGIEKDRFDSNEIIPVNNKNAYVISKNSNTIFKYNKGAWQPMPGWPKAIDLDVDEDGNLWKVTDKGELEYGYNNGLWKRIYSPGQNGVKPIDISVYDKNTIYGVDGSSNLYLFFSYFNTWIKMARLSNNEKAKKVDFKPGNRIYIVTESGKLFSLIDSVTFENINHNLYKVVDVSAGETDVMVSGRSSQGMQYNQIFRLGHTNNHKEWRTIGIEGDKVTFDLEGNPWIIANEGEEDDDKVFMGFTSYELLKNTNFTPEKQFSNWELKLKDNGRAFKKYENKRAKVVVKTTEGKSTRVDSVSLCQDNVRLESSLWYRLTFDIVATYDELGTVGIDVIDSSGRSIFIQPRLFQQEQKTQKFQLDFDNRSDSDKYTIKVCLGGTSQIYVVDNISLRCLGLKKASAVKQWKTGILYDVGDVVEHKGRTWKNTYRHTSQVDWYPGAPGLWFWKEQ